MSTPKAGDPARFLPKNLRGAKGAHDDKREKPRGNDPG